MDTTIYTTIENAIDITINTIIDIAIDIRRQFIEHCCTLIHYTVDNTEDMKHLTS